MKDFGFAQKLLDWFYVNKRAMPWRETKDPYRIWLSEVMLQQTQVDTVIPYYNRFISSYPDLHSLAKAADDDVLKFWEGLGYYRRCHHFIKAVKDVSVSYGGQVPDDPGVFRGLPGVGDYTTAAVMSIAYGHVLPVVDGNVIRVITRYDRIADDAGKAGTKKRILDLMASRIPEDAPGDFNQAVMELGATICTPKNPKCGDCPLSHGCGAFHDGDVHRYPHMGKKPKIPEYRVGLGLIYKEAEDCFLIQKRPSSGHLAGLWELPGGKSVGDETEKQALIRKCREELDLDVFIKEKQAVVTHTYSHFKIHVSVYLCDAGHQKEKALKNQGLAWITANELPRYTFPSANHKIFKKIFPQII